MLENMFQVASVMLTGQYRRLLNYFLSLSLSLMAGPINKSYFLFYIAFTGHSFNINVVRFHFSEMCLE